MALNIVARKIEVEKANNGGVLKYKAMTDIVNSMKPTLPWLTKDMLRNHIKKLNKEKMKREAARPPDDVDAAASPANDGGGQSTSTLSALTLDTGGNSDTMPGITSSGSEDNLGGRPKGSSAESKRDLKERKRLATLAATKQYQEELKKKRKQDGSTARLMHGTLATIIEKAKAFYNVENSTINPSTIRSRCKRNHIDPVVSQGTTSPMAAVEPYLIAVILQLAQMRCPINATMGLPSCQFHDRRDSDSKSHHGEAGEAPEEAEVNHNARVVLLVVVVDAQRHRFHLPHCFLQTTTRRRATSNCRGRRDKNAVRNWILEQIHEKASAYHPKQTLGEI